MAYVGNQPVPQATQTRDRFVATSGQTSFATSGYTPNFVDVYLDGVKLDSSEYTAINGSDVVLASGASTGQIMEVIAQSGFNASEKLPDQTSHNGKYLTTDGSSLSWGTITAPTPAAVSDQSNTSTGFFDVPTGTTAERPASPNSGMLRYNTTVGAMEYYNGTAWTQQFIQQYDIDYLVVAGGGGGGGFGQAGGGGAGGMLTTSNKAIDSGVSYSITVGAGGAGGNASSSASALGASGGDSSLGVLATAVGGGGATGHSGTSASGGSGGGAPTNGSYGSGTAGQGNRGGAFNGSYTSPYGGGGGGGAGAVGGDGGNTIGAGGAGLAWLNGTYYAGGGGGGSYSGGTSVGGIGGGGAGRPGTGSSSTAANGFPGSTNLGGGGGGAGNYNVGSTGGAGGSGVVIIRYQGAQRGTGGTVTSSGGYTYHTFTSSGTYIA